MTFLFFAGGYFAISAVLYAVLRARCKRNRVFKAPRSRWAYYALSFTWGLPAVLIGAVAALFVRMKGHRPERYGWEWGFALPGIDWGLSLGLFFIAPKNSEEVMAHELGHGVQNIYLGIFMPTVVLIPSFFRFRYRNLREKRGKPLKKRYDSIWFEDSATESGKALIGRLKRDGDSGKMRKRVRNGLPGSADGSDTDE